MPNDPNIIRQADRRMYLYLLLSAFKFIEMENQTRNLDPHRPAKCAMWLYHDRYAKLGIGSMNFWDRLTDSEKKICINMAEDISCTRPKSDDED